LFISSTSVYADDNSIVTEDTLPEPESESGKQVLEAENLLRENRNFKTTILRFGGLIGGDRHPVKFMAGKKGLANPYAPVNLIHRDDCIGIINAIIKKDAWNEIFNGVAPQHPTRKDYYTQKAVEMGLALPEFDDSAIPIGKTVKANKAIMELSYRFKYNLD
jgi:nucleoside-diphosphate-sugar epimerase